MAIIRDDSNVGAGQGNVPPPGAPHEVAQPLAPELIASQLEQAQQNEQELPPFKPRPADSTAVPITPGTVDQSAKPLRQPRREGATPNVSRGTLVSAEDQQAAAGVTPGQPAAHVLAGTGAPPVAAGSDDDSSDVSVVDGDPTIPIVVTAHIPGADGEPVSAPPPPQVATALGAAARQLMNQRPAIDPTKQYQPAASNSDSPSRGIPTKAADPGKQITGGWGDAGAAAYEPLSGDEVRAIVLDMIESLKAQLHSDLRFSLALTYPRFAARVIIEIEGYEDACNFSIPRRYVHERTPIELAREVANEFSFVVRVDKQEFDAQDQPDTPADAMRQAVGLIGPRKQVVQTPGGRMIVDRRS